MLYLEEPQGFTPKFEVVSCFIEYKNKILLLLRQDHKNEPNTYGVPAGKVNEGENINKAIIREIYEETGIEIQDKLAYFKKGFCKIPNLGIYIPYILQKIRRKTNHKNKSRRTQKIHTNQPRKGFRRKPNTRTG